MSEPDETADYKLFRTVETNELAKYVAKGTDIKIVAITETLNEIWFPPDTDLTLFKDI